MEISEYLTKESLAQQGGYGLATKGPQHDEAWLIFMDQVQNLLPTFEDKAEALHYFPMWRTWFSLHGLCKLPWNDISPENNQANCRTCQSGGACGKLHLDPPGRDRHPYHDRRLCWINPSASTTSRKSSPSAWDAWAANMTIPPYRAMGPVTVEEYESRQERYDEQLMRLVEVDPANMSTAEKMKALREYREAQYELLLDAVYKRRGWDGNSIPTQEKLKELGIDLQEVLEVVKWAKTQ